MATERAKTNIEAQRRITEQMDAVRPLLRKAMQSNDKAAIEKYSNEMTRLDRLMRATATITVGGVDVPIGAIGSGIQSGISGLFTAIPDIAVAGYNYFKPEPDKICLV
jgi:biopolymer transport protein ExbB/TolQ